MMDRAARGEKGSNRQDGINKSNFAQCYNWIKCISDAATPRGGVGDGGEKKDYTRNW